MRVHDMLVDQRHRFADLLEGLAPGQSGAPTLCAGWTVHDVAAHVVTYLLAGKQKLFVGVGITGGDVERVNAFFVRWYGRRTDDALVAMLRDRAGSHSTVPRNGYDPVLADLVLHELDVRLPLGIPGTVPEEPLWVSFHHIVSGAALGFRVGDRPAGLRLEAVDTGWTYGRGPVVRGPAESLLLAVSGRAAGLGPLDGDGVPLLRQRVVAPPRLDARRRAALMVGVLTSPPPRERRSRSALAPPLPTG